jgi:hypothetical protein
VSNNEESERYKQIRDWVMGKAKKVGVGKVKDLAILMSIPYSTLSTILGGKDRLSKGNLKKLVCGLVKLGCIKTLAEVGEMLDILHLCSGYKLTDEQENGLRKSAWEALKKLGSVSVNQYLEILATMDNLCKEVQGLPLGEFAMLQRELKRVGGRFEPMRYVVKQWREMQQRDTLY